MPAKDHSAEASQQHSGGGEISLLENKTTVLGHCNIKRNIGNNLNL